MQIELSPVIGGEQDGLEFRGIGELVALELWIVGIVD